MWLPPIFMTMNDSKEGAPANPQTTRTELVPRFLVLRTSKRFLLIRRPSHDFGFTKHSQKSKLFIKTSNKLVAFPKFTMVNNTFTAFPKFSNMWL